MNADTLRTIYEEIYGPLDSPGKMNNLRELAALLSRIANREKPWTHRYLNSLINGDKGFRMADELRIAIEALGMKRDGANPLQARLVEITAYSINGNVAPRLNHHRLFYPLPRLPRAIRALQQLAGLLWQGMSGEAQ